CRDNALGCWRNSADLGNRPRQAARERSRKRRSRGLSMPVAAAKNFEIAPIHVAVRGGARFKLPALSRDDELKRTLEAGLGGNGIRSVSANTSTGNVLILFDPG